MTHRAHLSGLRRQADGVAVGVRAGHLSVPSDPPTQSEQFQALRAAINPQAFH